MLVFVLIIIVIVAIWWGVQLHDKTSLENLKKTGFTVNYTLEGSPRVVFDDDQKKLAFIKLNDVLVYDYAEVLNWELNETQVSGWSNKQPTEGGYQITFHLQGTDDPRVQVQFSDEADARRWQQQLQNLLPRSTTNRLQ